MLYQQSSISKEFQNASTDFSTRLFREFNSDLRFINNSKLCFKVILLAKISVSNFKIFFFDIISKFVLFCTNYFIKKTFIDACSAYESKRSLDISENENSNGNSQVFINFCTFIHILVSENPQINEKTGMSSFHQKC